MPRPAQGQLSSIERAFAKEIADDRQQHARDRIGRGDHRLASDAIEQRPEQQRTEKIADREGQDVPADRGRGHAVELGQNECVGEEDGVVEKRLRAHQHEAEHGALRIVAHDRQHHAHHRRARGRGEANSAARRCRQLAHRRRARPGARSRSIDRFRLVEPGVQDQPARAFRDEAAQASGCRDRAPRRSRRRRASPNPAAGCPAAERRWRPPRRAPRRSRSCR